MKQVIIFCILLTSTFGAKLNQYLPPRPENNNAKYEPPALPNQPFTAASHSQQQFSSPNVHFNRNGNPKNQDISAQGSNSFQKFPNPTTFNGNTQGHPSSFGLKSTNQAPNAGSDNSFAPSFNSFNQKAAPNGQFGQSDSFSNSFNQPSGQRQYNGQFSGSQSAPIGLIRSEFNPDLGDGHYSYSYETENGISAQEEGFVRNKGKSAQGGFSYTSPEGEQITLEYTADENGFIPKGSHVPEIPEAILKSIELNKAAEARGEYNEGSYKPQGNVNGGYQRNGPREQSAFPSQENRQIASFSGPKSFGAQNNGYEYTGPFKSNNVANEGTFASQQSNQVTPFGGQLGFKPSFEQSNQNTFATQQNQRVAQFGQQQGLFAKTNERKPSFGSSSQFGQPNKASKDFNKQSNGYKYPVPEQSAFSSQQNKQVIPSGPQFSPRPQYGAPEQSSSASQNHGQFSSFQGPKSQVPNFSGKNEFNSQSAFQPKEPQSGTFKQFGTIQDSNGGYKY
ncbi:unnamed protein product [Diabrotica balteata]|uniref:Uncharacterized protein n=1 Tax=Diabrotica balteata TaxID=107213 RepID=A0A9N9SZU5_DIABA|nr:unnamed protein product [Diabrotica balteata]